MELRNSYIFLSKEKQTKSDESVKLTDLLDKFFPNLINNDIMEPDVYRGFVNGTHVTFVLNVTPVAGYCDVTVLHHYSAESVKCLEDINRTIMSDENDFYQHFVPIISFDSVSEYYCNRLHPKLNELDRKLRQLMFHIYTEHFGKDEATSNTFDELLLKMRESSSADAKGTDKTSIEFIRSAIKKLRKFRNKTAHCNFFYEKKYSQCQELVIRMIQTVDDAIELVDANEVIHNNKAYAKQMEIFASEISAMFTDLELLGEELFNLDKIVVTG